MEQVVSCSALGAALMAALIFENISPFGASPIRIVDPSRICRSRGTGSSVVLTMSRCVESLMRRAFNG